tara:strand:- start:36166 stop:36597 length:432 start_codon:yes stop_codon:yes gene_type:complete
MKKILLSLSIILLSACADHTHEIPAAYVSPLQYQDFSCKQIGAEMERVSRRANQVAYEVNENADGDATAMGLGLVLFWPALFFIDGDSPQAQEYARLKGEFDALEQIAIQKNCGLQVEETPFEKIERERKAQQNQPAHQKANQ